MSSKIQYKKEILEKKLNQIIQESTEQNKALKKILLQLKCAGGEDNSSHSKQKGNKTAQ